MKIVNEIENFIARFSTFPAIDYKLPLALWSLATYAHQAFDAFPYLVVTSATKQSGKTRLAEILSFVCCNPLPSGALTPAALFNSISPQDYESQKRREEGAEFIPPTVFFDEAESLSSESANNMRVVLNMGYRKGQKVVRMKGNEPVQYEVYCPKVFILIGDVYDTLRDRSIIVRMRRAEAKEHFRFGVAEADGQKLREFAQEEISEHRAEIEEEFAKHAGIKFLTDRDEEIWTPLFVMCKIFAPERLPELERLAVDIATEKTQDARRYSEIEGAEEKAQDDRYARQLLLDVSIVMGKAKAMATATVLDKLKALPTSPWRVYKGEGITMHSLSQLLSRFGLAPVNVRIGSGRKDSKVVKGYRLLDVQQACKEGKIA